MTHIPGPKKRRSSDMQNPLIQQVKNCNIKSRSQHSHTLSQAQTAHTGGTSEFKGREKSLKLQDGRGEGKNTYIHSITDLDFGIPALFTNQKITREVTRATVSVVRRMCEHSLIVQSLALPRVTVQRDEQRSLHISAHPDLQDVIFFGKGVIADVILSEEVIL